MCLCPLPVKSNKLDFNPFKDSFINYVPCGTCRECRESYSNGYVARLLAHYNYIRSFGYKTLYFTLTYDRFNLPKYKDLVCFNKKHLQNYFKRLRKSGLKFDYFVTSEYGDNKKRPHYHIVIYLLSNFPLSKAIQTFKGEWIYGNAFFGINNGVVLDNRPFYYCTKYLTKSVDEFYHINKFSDFDLQDFVTNALPLGYTFRHFHLASKGIGQTLLDSLKDIDFIKGYFNSLDISGKNVKLPIPLYIYRKKCYEVYTNKHGNISYTLNSYGKSLIRKRFHYQYQKHFESIKALIPNLDFYYDFLRPLHSLVSPSLLPEFKSRLTDDFLKSFVAWKLFYSRFDTLKFSFIDFHKDLDFFIECLDYPDFIFDSPIHYYHPSTSDFIILDKVFNILSNHLKYRAYVDNTNLFNTRQSIISLRTGKRKIYPVESFKTFKNYSPLCLTIFKNLRNPKNKKVSHAQLNYSALSLAV